MATHYGCDTLVGGLKQSLTIYVTTQQHSVSRHQLVCLMKDEQAMALWWAMLADCQHGCGLALRACGT